VPQSRYESLICSDAELAQLDNIINELIGISRDWVAHREQRCDSTSNAKQKSCLARMLKDRIGDLGGN
jgi:hypothetical protein